MNYLTDYLALGSLLWLFSNKSYFRFDNFPMIVASVFTTLNIIMFWPLAWGAVIVVFLQSMRKER